MTKKVKVRWWSGRRYRDPDDIVEAPLDATDEDIETALFGKQGRMEPVVLAAAKLTDTTSLIVTRVGSGKFKAAKPPVAAM